MLKSKIPRILVSGLLSTIVARTLMVNNLMVYDVSSVRDNLMPGDIWAKSGEEWQGTCSSLLTLRFGLGEYNQIPDQTQGDCGIEGFTRCGKAFQCYAPQEPLGSKDLTKKQKVKITQDIQKLETYKLQIASLLGQTVLNRWILLVPRWVNKDVLSHAEAEICKLRAKNLPFIDPNIQPAIHTLEDLAVEYQAFLLSGQGSLVVEAEIPSQEDVDHWTSNTELAFLQNLDQKATKIMSDRPEFIDGEAEFKKMTVDNVLRGKNALERLRTQFEELYDKVMTAKFVREDSLRSETLLNRVVPAEHLRSLMQSYNETLKQVLPGLSDQTRAILVDEAIADWIIRCPLRYP